MRVEARHREMRLRCLVPVVRAVILVRVVAVQPADRVVGLAVAQGFPVVLVASTAFRVAATVLREFPAAVHVRLTRATVVNREFVATQTRALTAGGRCWDRLELRVATVPRCVALNQRSSAGFVLLRRRRSSFQRLVRSSFLEVFVGESLFSCRGFDWRCC